MRERCHGIFAAVVFLLLAGPAAAASFNLSDLSSDGTPAAQLKAQVDFEVGGPTLSLTVRNQTSSATPFDIAGVFFNASPDVIALTFIGAQAGNGSWAFFASGKGVSSPTFGNFDFALGGTKNPLGQILHGSSNTFMFSITCKSGAICDASDFGNGPSTGGQRAAVAGLSFVDGPGGDTAFGASTQTLPVPEPSTALLLALGLTGFAGSRGARRR